MNKIRIILFICLLTSHAGFLLAQDFEHPGIFHKESDFARMRQKVAEKAEPWYTAWTNLLNSPEAQLTWNSRATATVIRGGTGDNVAVLYRDVASAYQHALIWKISGNAAHGNKAVQILNSWSATHKLLSGNADRYLASGLFGYQFANAAEMMRDYPGFEFERFKKYMLNVFYYPLVERFLYGNSYGRDHNDACITNYRANWDLCNMAAMLAIGILCDNREIYNKGINYFKNGGGNGCIKKTVNFLYGDTLGQWEESGRDQGHTVGGLALAGMFCEIAYNQGDDCFSYDNYRLLKGAEYISRYNILLNGTGKYDDLPFTSYSYQMGSNCAWRTEAIISSAGRGHGSPAFEQLYDHYAHRAGLYNKSRNIKEMLAQSPSLGVPSVSIHPETYDNPQLGALTFRIDSGSCILPWQNMEIAPVSITKQPYYGSATITDTNSIIVKGSGSGIQGKADGFHFVFQKLLDDGQIIARLTSLNDVNSLCQAGLMIRERLNQTSVNLFLSLSAVKGVLFTSRDTSGGFTSSINNNSANAFPYWLRLSRSEDVFTASVSSDRSNWVEVGSKTLRMAPDVYIGLAVSGYDNDTICTSVFDEVEIIRGNAKPVAKILSPENGYNKYIGPANITINGLAYDSDGELDKAELSVGNLVVATFTASSFSYSWNDVSEGTYKISLKAFDKLGGTRSSDTITVTVNAKTTKLPWYKFDETQGTYLAYDANGNNLTSVLTGGANFLAGRINNAANLDGVDDYVRLPTAFLLHQLSDFTITCWVYLNSLNTWSRIFDFGTGTGSYMFLTPYNNAGLMSFSLLAENGRSQAVTSSTIPSAGQWHHIAVTLGGNTLKIYLNGTVVGSSASFSLKPYDIGTALNNYLGKSQFNADPYLNGKLDDVRFFNTALNVEEINTIKNDINTVLREVKTSGSLVYPNPARNRITVAGSVQSSLCIYNSLGQVVLRKNLNEIKEDINIGSFPKGSYFLVVTDSKRTKKQELLIVQ